MENQNEQAETKSKEDGERVAQQPVVMRWEPLNDWKKLPEGDWLVKITKDRKPYHVASVSRNTGDGHKIIIVGNHFHWDMGDLIAYSPFAPYDES